jgi:hypothetical protein
VAGLLRKTTAGDGAPPGAVAGGSSSDIVGNVEEKMTQLWTGLDDGEHNVTTSVAVAGVRAER